MSSFEQQGNPLDDVVPYYENEYDEGDRLKKPIGQLEMLRTRAIIKRYLPKAPAVVLDVGGGTGVYAAWLAEEGYEVHLVDPVTRHAEQARQASQAQDSPLASITVGDARSLDMASDSADAVLLLGPLYHLPNREDRLTALREAYRILKVGGHVFVAAISRFASLLSAFFHFGIEDGEIVQIIKQTLANGCHYNPPGKPYFTTAYFHLPEELQSEVESLGFEHRNTLAVEGPFWLMQNFQDQWDTKEGRQRIIDAMTWIEEEPAILGVSDHIMCIGRKGDKVKKNHQ